MALYDQRTFKWRDQWWVAEVHSAAGAGVGSGKPTRSIERAIFTNLSDPNTLSRSARLPAGSLNRLSHQSIGMLLDGAEGWEGRLDIWPRNAPDDDELGRFPHVEDEFGLMWVYRMVDRLEWVGGEARVRPALELICLDDSALRGDVAFQDTATLQGYLQTVGDYGVKTLIPYVVKTYRDLDADWLQ